MTEFIKNNKKLKSIDECHKICYSCNRLQFCLKGCTLEHSIGKNNISETVLTKKEFCSRLTYLRDKGALPEHEEKLPQKKNLLSNVENKE